MSRIITVNNVNRLWQNGVLPIKQELETKIDELEETGGNTVVNKLSTYDDIMANEVEGYIPDALAVKEGFTQVNESLTANNSDGSFVDLSSYKSESNRYTFPSDGYLVLSFEGLKATYMRVPVFSANGNIIAQLWSAGLTDYNAYSSDIKSLFVKKGMSAYVSINTGGNNEIRFYPIS